MSGRKRTFRLNPMVGAPRRRPPRRRLQRTARSRIRRSFIVAWLAAGCALAVTIVLVDMAWAR